MKDHYKIGEQFKEEQCEQTDFGRIYYDTPRVHHAPETIEELANLLKKYNTESERVTIRNTGHSVNGQTLTKGVQIGLEKLKWTVFDTEKQIVTVGAGTSWDQMLKAINFPTFSPTVFPNNPGQRIHVGGTAAVGGAGPFSSKYGGFWNIVEEITLVTMEGKIFVCSRKENPDYFKFSLGGFGRIGVIAEIKIKVEKCKQKVLAAPIFFESRTHLFDAFTLALEDDTNDSVALYRSYIPIPLTHHHSFVTPHVLCIMCEVDDNEELHSKATHIKDRYKHGTVLFGAPCNNPAAAETLSISPCVLSRQEVVYWYPEDKKETQMDFPQVWSDYILPPHSIKSFVEEGEKIMDRYNLGDSMVKVQTGFGQSAIGISGGCMVKKVATDFDFPLSLDLPNEKEVFGPSVFLSVPRSKVSEAVAMTNELTELAFKLGGKRYLYGYHDLTKEQVEKQFGIETIKKWNAIKGTLDPKHLLNIDVIEHLD